MIELIQITNDPAFARRCDAVGGIRLFVDLEHLGKAERQAGHNTFISTHAVQDVGRIKRVLRQSRLMVRVNPLNAQSLEELDAVLAQGPDLLMLPMFKAPGELREFSRLVDGRCPIVPLLETSEALESMEQWAATPDLEEIFLGLNDLHLSMGLRFMFEPLAMGLVDQVAACARRNGLRFGFGGIARMEEGVLPGRDVLAEHVRLGSKAVILSRTFRRNEIGLGFEEEVAALRKRETALAGRTVQEAQQESARIAAAIARIAADLAQQK